MEDLIEAKSIVSLIEVKAIQALTCPFWTSLCGGTLRFSRHWILVNVCITQVDIVIFAFVSPVEAELRMGLIEVEPSASSILVKHVVKGFMVCKNFAFNFF